jgi:hypothetical protein
MFDKEEIGILWKKFGSWIVLFLLVVVSVAWVVSHFDSTILLVAFVTFPPFFALEGYNTYNNKKIYGIEILRKCRNIVKYFHHSIPANQKLKHNSIGKNVNFNKKYLLDSIRFLTC